MAAAFVAVNADVAYTVVSGSTATGTTTRDIQSGEHVVVSTSIHGTSTAVSSITVGGLSLTRDASKGVDTTYAATETWSAHASALIPSGSTVTITWAGSSTHARGGICHSLSGVASTSYVRGSPATGSGTTANPSVTSDATPQVGDIALAAASFMSSSAATAGTGYTIPANGTIAEGTQGTSLAVEYQVLGSGGATTAGLTHAANNWTETLVVYAAAGASGYPKLIGMWVG